MLSKQLDQEVLCEETDWHAVASRIASFGHRVVPTRKGKPLYAFKHGQTYTQKSDYQKGDGVDGVALILDNLCLLDWDGYKAASVSLQDVEAAVGTLPTPFQTREGKNSRHYIYRLPDDQSLEGTSQSVDGSYLSCVDFKRGNQLAYLKAGKVVNWEALRSPQSAPAALIDVFIGDRDRDAGGHFDESDDFDRAADLAKFDDKTWESLSRAARKIPSSFLNGSRQWVKVAMALKGLAGTDYEERALDLYHELYADDFPTDEHHHERIAKWAEVKASGKLTYRSIFQWAKELDQSESEDRGANIVSVSQMLAEQPSFEYIWQGILLRGWLYAMVASPGSGKTSIALYISMMIALGRSIGGHETKAGKVLYLCGENPQDVRMRVEVMLTEMNIDLSEIEGKIYFTRRPFAIDQRKSLAAFVKEAQEFGPFDFCVIDTAPSHSDTQDENDNRQMHELAMAFRHFMHPLGMPSTIAIMHPVKGATRGGLLPRGASAFTGSLDGILCVWRETRTEPVELFAHDEKWRHKHFTPMQFALHGVTHPTLRDNFDQPVESVIAKYVEPIADNPSAFQDRDKEIRDGLLEFIDALNKEGDWIGIATGKGANNPFQRGRVVHPKYPQVLKSQSDEVKQRTYIVINDMIAKGLLTHEEGPTRQGQRQREYKLQLRLTTKGEDLLRENTTFGSIVAAEMAVKSGGGS